VSAGVVAVTADEELESVWASDAVALDALEGAIRAWIPDNGGAWILVDRRNLENPESWALPEGATRQGAVSTVSAIGQAAVRDPSVVRQSVAAVRSVAPEARWWAVDATFSAVVDPDRVEDAQRALFGVLLGRGSPR